ncbi:MAG: hypothetical protein RL367_599 [Pseudomonadota bacterium]|jgi:uncharacterized protein (DUF433 family)
MSALAGMLKTTEAAMVSCVSPRDVNRVIDEGLMPSFLFNTDDGRHVTPAGCVFISFYFASADRLTSDERMHAIKVLAPKLRKWKWNNPRVRAADCIVRHDFLTIDVAPFVLGATSRWRQLTDACKNVMSEPDILGGTPVIRGTRVPAHDVAASVAAGYSVADIIAAYPSLNAETVELATLYAKANPLRGRPRNGRTTGLVLQSERRVERRSHSG